MRDLGVAEQLLHGCDGRIKAHLAGQLDQCAAVVRAIHGNCDGCFHLGCDQAEVIVQKCGLKIDRFLISKLAYVYNLLERFGVQFPSIDQLEERAGKAGPILPARPAQPGAPQGRGRPVKFVGGPNRDNLGMAAERQIAGLPPLPIGLERQALLDEQGEEPPGVLLVPPPDAPELLPAPRVMPDDLAGGADDAGQRMQIDMQRRLEQMLQAILDRNGPPGRPGFGPLGGTFSLSDGSQVVLLPICCPAPFVATDAPFADTSPQPEQWEWPLEEVE